LRIKVAIGSRDGAQRLSSLHEEKQSLVGRNDDACDLFKMLFIRQSPVTATMSLVDDGAKMNRFMQM